MNSGTTKVIPLGTKFGHLEVIGVGEPKIWNGVRNSTSICRCSCGVIVTYPNNVLRKGRATSCGARIHKTKENHSPRYISNGYVFVYNPSHPKANNAGYVREHILVMEKHLGRYLSPEEVVHHIDFNRKNNDLCNLLLMTRSSHATLHATILANQLGYHSSHERVCRECGGKTSRYGVLCKQCSLKKQTKIRLPDKTILQDLVNRLSISEVARKVGVSSTSLIRWLKKLGISYPNRKNIGNIAVCQTKESREKSRQSQLRYYETHSGIGSIRVGQFDKSGNLIRTYSSIAEVESFGFVKTCVSRVVSGQRKSHKGFIWKRIS